MNICVIPARGGSKRIPRKNIKDFFGKPLIAYSIETAIKSNLFQRVIVSTDDEEIAIIAKKYGAEIPYLRPKELSDDFTGTADVVNHAVEYFENLGEKYVDEPELWIKTEELVREALIEGSIPFEEIPGEAAFYGPKIDVQVWSAIGREFTLATNQVDFAIPKRFNLSYIDETIRHS